MTTDIVPAVRSELAPTGTLRVGINHGNFLLVTPGSSAAESCMLSRIRGWNFPRAADAGAGTYSFPFNFTT